jgi:POT family proton-dependent oligopeptide transporter
MRESKRVLALYTFTRRYTSEARIRAGLTKRNLKCSAHFMAKAQYLTAPVKTDKMPPGVPYIVGNEAAERFSYYGMNGILVFFMTHYLLNRQGQPAHMDPDQAGAWYHTFVSCVYLLPLLGALLGDAILGKYRTILYLSIVYCFGHLTLALDHTRVGLALGLGLIALGAGGIKPCVSANVGDQFGIS